MSNIQISLSLVEFMEDNFYIVYSPALDLSGYAMTAEEARQSFTETLAYFLEHALDNKTLNQDLIRLGWKITQQTLVPPSLPEIISHNPNFVEIFEKHDLKKVSIPIEMPLLAA
jgi:hypothetical protein